MADDELRDSNQRTLSDDLLGIGEAAVGVVAGAALFYRSGGAKYLAEGVERASRFVTHAHSAISARSLADWNPDEMRNVASGFKKAWREIGDDVRDRNIGIRNGDHRSAFGALEEIARMDSNPGEITSRMYNREKLINPTYEHFQDNLSNGNETFEKKMFDFVDGLATKLSNDVNISDHMDASGFTEQEKSIAGQVVDHMRGLDSASERNSFKAANEHIARQVSATASRLEELEAQYGTSFKGPSAVDKILGDRPATIGDIIENRRNVQESRNFMQEGRDHKFEDTMASLDRLREKYKGMGEDFEQRFLALTPDAAVLRKDSKGNINSFKSASKIVDGTLDFLAGTLPGKLLKLRDVQYSQKASALQYIGKGETDPILAALANSQKGNSEVDNHYFRILNKVYRTTDEGLVHVKEADNTSLMSGNFGTRSKLLRQIMGHVDYQRSGNVLARIFDVGQDGEVTHLQSMRSVFSKFNDDTWHGNIAKRLLDPSEGQKAIHEAALINRDHDYAVSYLSKLLKYNSFLSKNSYGLSPEAIRKMTPHVSGEAQSILESLQLSGDEMVKAIISREGASGGRPDRWKNHDLRSLIHQYVTKHKSTADAITLKSDRSGFETFDFGGAKETAEFHDIFRMELGKEMFLQHAHANEAKYGKENMHEAIVDLIRETGLTGKERTEAKRLGHWAAFQDLTNISARTDNIRVRSTERMWSAIAKTDKLFDKNATDSFHKDFRDTMIKTVKDNLDNTDSYVAQNTKAAGRRRYGDWIHIQNAVTPMDVVRSLNNKTKFKATGGKFVKQFFAGRNDPHNITNATMYPYFALARLSDELNKFGLGFSKESSGSVGKLAKGIALKRLLPVGVGATYLNWMDDTSEEVTGTSLSGAFANGLANIDLAYRKTSDAIGLTGLMKDEKSINPMMQYWFGKDPYQSYDERKDYYENGYDPVRKGRYWTFGGVNEFRGGQIAYFEPNFVKRINSDYSDKSMYDGYLDKWSHSWLPTPSNPLSPLVALADPYWLEKKHSEDRPYPVSGTLFSEGTPWGAVLNPTIGEMIKPQIRMHKDRLQDGIDTKALIYKMNKDIQTRALNNDNQNLIVMKGGSMEPMEYTAYNAPTMDERGYTMQFNGSKSTGVLAADYGVYSGGVSPSDYLNSSSDGVGMPLSVMPAESTELSVAEKIQLSVASGGTLSRAATNYINSVSPKSYTRSLNNEIFARAQVNESQGVMTPEKIVNLKASYGASMLSEAETIDELMNQSSGNDMIKEMALSTKLITGIYGYGANKALGFGNNTQKRIATSADIDNPFRTFWDSGFAGAGGGVSEIARRFMPEFKRNTRVNPLMNTMDDWLPERFRFGDPYTAVPKGEMRMPGKGYESLNELHPDQFGEYGAFDRFKILADIAPYSPEYKIWKKIAQKTVMDPKLKEEMKKAKARVSQQSKQHEFYDYQFVGRGVDYSNVTVTEVLDRGKFKIHGSDEIYKLAGIKLKANEKGMGTQEIVSQYLHAGQQITMAIDENPSYQKNTDKDRSVSAAVYIDGENLSTKLLDEGIAQVRKGDQSAAATVGKYSGLQQFRGRVAETIAHLDLPLVYDRWLRVRSPLESYKAEQVYGTPYQTWSDPIGTFLLPAMERSISDNKQVIIGEVASYLQRISENVEGLGKTNRKIINGAYMLANRGAFIGGTLGYLLKPDSGKVMLGGAKIGSTLMTIAHLYTGVNDPFESALGFGHVGYEIAELTKKSRIKSVALGAAIGVAISGANYSVLNENKDWVPDRTKKKWEMQEYFDRLNYIKYMGLYHRASEKAEDEEGVNVENLVARQEADAKKKERLREELTNAKMGLGKLPDGEMRQYLEGIVNKKLQVAQDDKIVLRAGRWTESALLYKQAADSTMYGLKEGTTYAQVIRALPKNDREYFLEFIKERDPERREQILKTSSPLLKRALQHSWGIDQGEMESNSSYFMNHNLPTFSWSGWRPDVDLADVQVKTIHNEGMSLGDYGLFDSELRNPDVINAPNLSPSGQQDPLTLQTNLLATLKGLGLYGVDVSVQPGPESGIQVVANVARIVEFKIDETVRDIFRLM